MKYGYDNIPDSMVIDNFKTNSDRLVVTHIDGSKVTLEKTEEREKELLNIMLQQARERNQSDALFDARSNRRRNIRWLVAEAGVTSFNVSSLINASTPERRSGFICLVCLTSVFSAFYGIQAYCNNKEVQEIKKYKIYLRIKDDLETTINPIVTDHVNSLELNINTLDNYSLRDIEELENALYATQRYENAFSRTMK